MPIHCIWSDSNTLYVVLHIDVQAALDGYGASTAAYWYGLCFLSRKDFSESFSLLGNTMTKMRFTQHPSKPLKRKQGSPHCFLICCLPTTIPFPLSYQGFVFNTRRWIYPVCLVGPSPTTYQATRLIVVDRSLQIGVIAFDLALTPFNFVVELILLKSIVIDGRDLKTPRLSPTSLCQIRPGNLHPVTSLLGFVKISPIWDRWGSRNSEAIADKSARMRPGNLPPETSLSGFVDAWVRSEIGRGLETPRLSPTSPHECGFLLGFVDAWVRSEIGRGLETPRLSPTSPHECGQEIYHLRLPFRFRQRIRPISIRSAGV
jgi:hypothetical protein